MNYQEKYLKYKNKYLTLKNKIGGAANTNQIEYQYNEFQKKILYEIEDDREIKAIAFIKKKTPNIDIDELLSELKDKILEYKEYKFYIPEVYNFLIEKLFIIDYLENFNNSINFLVDNEFYDIKTIFNNEIITLFDLGGNQFDITITPEITTLKRLFILLKNKYPILADSTFNITFNGKIINNFFKFLNLIHKSNIMDKYMIDYQAIGDTNEYTESITEISKLMRLHNYMSPSNYEEPFSQSELAKIYEIHHYADLDDISKRFHMKYALGHYDKWIKLNYTSPIIKKDVYSEDESSEDESGEDEYSEDEYSKDFKDEYGTNKPCKMCIICTGNFMPEGINNCELIGQMHEYYYQKSMSGKCQICRVDKYDYDNYEKSCNWGKEKVQDLCNSNWYIE